MTKAEEIVQLLRRGLSDREVAAAMGCPLNTVRARLSEARRGKHGGLQGVEIAKQTHKHRVCKEPAVQAMDHEFRSRLLRANWHHCHDLAEEIRRNGYRTWQSVNIPHERDTHVPSIRPMLFSPVGSPCAMCEAN